MTKAIVALYVASCSATLVWAQAPAREGGNAFHGTFFANGANSAMARSNYDSNLKAQGLASPTGFDRLVDESAGFGGPILKDRLWFYYAERYRDNDSSTGVDFFSINPLQTTPTCRRRCIRVALTLTTRFA